MTPTMRSLTVLAAATLLVSACSPQPDPNARKVIAACYAMSADEGTAILGVTVTANKMAGDDAPRAICAYNDATNAPRALIQLQKADTIKDQAADLAAELNQAKVLFNGIVKPVITHPANGYPAGSFFADITPRADTTSVRMYTFENGYKLMVLVNNPKDFASGEKTADTIAKKVAENIQNGNAFTPI